MESLTPHEGYYTLGGANAGRMPAARYRLLEDKFYVPLAELVQMGMQKIQHDPRIAQIYSQSAGLADFLMHDAGGRYRDALVRYLEAIYSGRATAGTLATDDRDLRKARQPVRRIPPPGRAGQNHGPPRRAVEFDAKSPATTDRTSRGQPLGCSTACESCWLLWRCWWPSTWDLPCKSIGRREHRGAASLAAPGNPRGA